MQLQSKKYNDRGKMKLVFEPSKNYIHFKGEIPVWKLNQNGNFELVKGDINYRRNFETIFPLKYKHFESTYKSKHIVKFSTIWKE